MRVAGSGCPFVKASITSLIFGEERKSGSLCAAPSTISCTPFGNPRRGAEAHVLPPLRGVQGSSTSFRRQTKPQPPPSSLSASISSFEPFFMGR